MNRFTYWHAILPLTGLLLYFTVRAIHAPFSDFAGYYFGSLELWQGHYQTTYDTYSLNGSIAQKGYTVFVSYTPFPPFTALVMAPFLWLPVVVAKIAFNLFSAALFLMTVYRAGKFFDVPAWVIAILPLIFCIPLRNHLLLGQGYLLLTVLLLEGYMAYKKGQLVGAGLLWALAMLFKVFPVCILLFLLVRKQYKQLVYCLAFAAVLGMISLWCVGFEAWKYYLLTLMPRLSNGELNDSYTYIFQSAFMLFKNLFTVYPFVIVNIIFKAVVLAFAAALTKKNEFLAFGAWVMASMLISPNGSSYSLILLVIPLMALHKPWPLVALICWLPVQWFGDWPVLAQYPRLYLMVVLFVLIAGIQLPWKPALVFMMIFLAADLRKFFADDDKSRILLAGPSPLIYRFAVEQDRLVYYYWDKEGSHEVVTDSGVFTTADIPIINNQLVYKGKTLTHSEDLKKQAMLVNGSQVVYLSDKDRGVGFYTLRVIQQLPELFNHIRGANSLHTPVIPSARQFLIHVHTR